MKSASLAELTLADFSRLLNTEFRVTLDPSNTAQFKLVEASPRGSPIKAGQSGPDAQGESFSLVFRGPAERLFPQKMYTFEHDEIGTFVLFIVPIGKEPDGFQYEAVFNRTGRRV